MARVSQAPGQTAFDRDEADAAGIAARRVGRPRPAAWSAVAGVIALLALFDAVVEHLGPRLGSADVYPHPSTCKGIGWILVGSGLVGAIARPSPARRPGMLLPHAGFSLVRGRPRQNEFPILDDLAFAFQGYFDLVLILIVLCRSGTMARAS